MEPVKIENFSQIKALVLMCVGTDKGSWWADAEFGSHLWKIKQTGKTIELLADDVRREIESCLEWLVADGLAKSIVCTTAISGKTRIDWVVTVSQPDGNQQIVKDVWDAF